MLLVANAVLLAAVAFIAWRYVDRPAGLLIAVGALCGSGGLIGCVPLTDPYRDEQRRWRAEQSPRRS